MKRLATTARYMLFGALLAPVASWATPTWSTCQTITSVTDYTAYNNSIYMNLYPGITGCSADTTGGAIIQMSATLSLDQYKNLYATTMLAYSLNKPVTLYYDNSQAPACFVQVVSIGGYTNSCD